MDKDTDSIREDSDVKEFTDKYIHKEHPVVRALKTDDEMAERVDWREHDAVTKVVHQGNCGSCWAFSTAGILEGAYSIKTGKPAVPLSVQQMLDCVNPSNGVTLRTKGCDGGLVQEVLDYFEDSYINEAGKYPYRGRLKECRQRGWQLAPLKEEKRIFMDKIDRLLRRDQGDKRLSFLMNVKRWFKIQSYSPAALKKALTMGPVSITMNADNLPFEFYFGGIIQSKRCKPEVNHMVLAIGYGVQ